MTTFVLVHGAYHGGWCWGRVAERLRALGHAAFTPTLTGLGERAHLLTPAVGLHTMIDDVVGVLECEELADVVLVGHSFGALPVLGALPRVAPRTRRAVILDGIVVAAGSNGFSGLPRTAVQDRREAAERTGGLSLPPPPAEFFGVREPDDVAWVTRRLRPHPLRSYTDRLPESGGPLDAGLPVTYLRCTEPVFAGTAASVSLARDLGWDCRDIRASHDAMITHPGEITAELHALAS